MFGCAISINISPLTGLESLKLIREGVKLHSLSEKLGITIVKPEKS
jgi:hypothetical protein